MATDPDSLTRWRPLDTLSVGGWTILVIAAISSVLLLVWPRQHREGLAMWVFTVEHAKLYEPLLEERREQADGPGHVDVNLTVIDGAAMTRRILAGFWGDTPLADLMEVETDMMSRFTGGPLESMGFVDLTDRLQEEGLIGKINPPSFSPWTSRGRVFGLPHDVHPTLLAYRADIVEEAGIDVGEIETWDDFERVMQPLLDDNDDDGEPDHYPLAIWYSDSYTIEPLLLQAGGGLFHADGRPSLDRPENARVVAEVVSWCVGPDRIAVDAPKFTFSGDQLKIRGKVVCEVMPDWLAGVWKRTLPQLHGKVKLMPLPAWEPGGRRTTVMGGTMLGFPKRTLDSAGDGTGEPTFEAAWSFAKELYLDRAYSERLFRKTNIITPVTDYWSEDWFHEPDPYFSGQQSGTLFLEHAPNVPLRTPSPFVVAARLRLSEVLGRVYRLAEERAVYDAAELEPFAAELLRGVQARMEEEMSRNVFLSGDDADAASAPAPAPAPQEAP